MQKKIKFFQLLDLISSDNWRIIDFFSKNFSISSFQIVSALYNYVKELNTIIDIGANRGQFALTACKKYKSSKIYSFEPDPVTFQKLKSRCYRKHNIKIFNYALGNKTGDISFHKYKDSQTNSILKTASGQIELDPESTIYDVIKVPIFRFDELLPKINLQHPTLIKIDVQGYEEQVIDGMKGMLDHIDYLLIELSFVEMYENEPLFDDINKLLNNLGFRLSAPLGFLLGKNQKIYQMDFLYKK